ncbi:methionine--tRNA ligase [Pantoea ananatis]|uniref:methionine--tRNA ligase n=1 Tax=Pantoea ananas TaxID=553 RepID=UPI003FA411E8
MAKYIVTATPPTPNGDLHLGHLSGPFMAADVMQRRLKQLGHDVLFVTYSDDYQSYLPRKSKALRRKPFAYARLMRQAMQLSLELVDIRFDIFMQAADTPAYQRSGEHYASLVANQITLKEHKTFYCTDCNLYGYEGFGRTQCNWCGTSSDTSQCEHCARVPEVEKITDMTCMSCNGAMEPVLVKQHIWKIGQNYPAVKAALQHRSTRVCLTSYLEDVLSNENEHWPLTRPGDAGLPVAAMDNYPLHTWFLGLSGYRSCVESYLDANPGRGEFSEWWAPETELVHLLGFDCSYSHAVGYSSLLLADQNGPRPGYFITNRFLKLDGEDFSTSRGHAVWIKDLTGQYPSDAIRLFCALTAPETAVSNFSRDDFKQWYQQTFLHLIKQAEQKTSFTETLITDQIQSLRNNSAYLEWLHAASIETFSIAGMAQAALDFFAFIQSDDKLSIAREAWQILAELMQPLCPDLAATILSVSISDVQSAKVIHELV